MSLKEKLKSNSPCMGAWLTIPHISVAEILCQKKIDWLCIDMEHTATTVEDVFRLLPVCNSFGVPAIVRVPNHDNALIKKIMDLGAHGIIAPQVNSLEEAQNVVNAVKYPPTGQRGVGLFRAQNYGRNFKNYFKNNNNESVVIVQIENKKAIPEAEKILSLEGVDASLLGPYDLSASLGCAGEFENPEYQAAYKEILKAHKAAGKPAGLHIVHPDKDLLKSKIDEGFQLIAYGTDFIFLDQASEKAFEA